MKRLFRKILFTDSLLYIYPYSLLNLNNDLDKIFSSKYFSALNLMGRRLSKDTFVLWNKWNIMLSLHGLAFFSGKAFHHDNKTFIIGTTYPNLFLAFGFYLSALLLTIALIDPLNWDSQNDRYFIIIGLTIVSTALFFTIRVSKRVVNNSIKNHLKIKNAPQQAV